MYKLPSMGRAPVTLKTYLSPRLDDVCVTSRLIAQTQETRLLQVSLRSDYLDETWVYRHGTGLGIDTALGPEQVLASEKGSATPQKSCCSQAVAV